MLLAQLNAQGFAVIETFLTETDCAQLSDALQTIDLDRTLRRGDITFGIRDLLNVAPLVRSFASSPRVWNVVDSIAGTNAQVVRAIFFDKTPEANWKVAWHQDLTISVRERKEVDGFVGWSVKAGVQHTQPPVEILENILTVRIHLDATNESNGALKVIAGSHKLGRLDADGIRRVQQSGAEVLCRVPKGGALLMRPLLVHASSKGVEPTRRRVIHLEFTAAKLPGGLRAFLDLALPGDYETVLSKIQTKD